MGGKSKAPPPPDYSGIAQASKESAEYSFQLGREQLAWAKEQYARDSDISQQVISDAIRRQDETDNQARADRQRYETIFQPLEERLITDANSYTDSRNRARGDAAAGRAAADVSSQFSLARAAAQDRLESFGIDPSQTRSAALDISSRTAEAAARAGAANQTREGVTRAEEATGRALRSEAINIGRGYPGQVAQSYGLAMQSGNQAANTGLATTASGAATMGTAPQWQGAGNQAVGQWGNTVNQGYSNQLNAWKANQSQSSGWGSVLGMAAGIGTKMALGPMGFAFEEGGAVEAIPTGALPVNAMHPQPGMGVHVDPRLSPSRGVQTDDIPARLNAGEFVVPADVVRWKGEEFFQKQIMSSRKNKTYAPAKPKMGAIPVQAPRVDTERALPV